MFVQEDLRNKNIAEYLLYMWQVEDMIRAAGLDSDRLYQVVIKDSGRSEADCQKWKQWYQDLIDMMHAEGKTQQGHLQINENVLMLLEDLHSRLLESHKQAEYKDLYYKALPFIVEFRAKNHEEQNNELRDCFNMLCGCSRYRVNRSVPLPSRLSMLYRLSLESWLCSTAKTSRAHWS